MKLIVCLKNWLNDDSGTTAIEYSFISGALALVLVPVLSNTSSGIASLFYDVVNAFNTIH